MFTKILLKESSTLAITSQFLDQQARQKVSLEPACQYFKFKTLTDFVSLPKNAVKSTTLVTSHQLTPRTKIPQCSGYHVCLTRTILLKGQPKQLVAGQQAQTTSVCMRFLFKHVNQSLVVCIFIWLYAFKKLYFRMVFPNLKQLILTCKLSTLIQEIDLKVYQNATSSSTTTTTSYF